MPPRALTLAIIVSSPCACAVVPDRAPEDRWRVSTVETVNEAGERRTSTVTYDDLGRRIRHQTRLGDVIERTVVYTFEPDGDVLERIDIEPDDVDRYRYRLTEDGRIELRMRDGDLDGRFGSYVLHAFGSDGSAVRREYRRIDGETDRIDAVEAELRSLGTYDYRDGRLAELATDRGADGDVDRVRSFRYDELGRTETAVTREGEEVIRTETFTYERGPCDTRSLVPEAAAFCVGG